MRTRAEIFAEYNNVDLQNKTIFETDVRGYREIQTLNVLKMCTELFSDIRDQNTRIIELLSHTRQHTHITDVLTRKQITVESPDGT